MYELLKIKVREFESKIEAWENLRRGSIQGNVKF